MGNSSSTVLTPEDENIDYSKVKEWVPTYKIVEKTRWITGEKYKGEIPTGKMQPIFYKEKDEILYCCRHIKDKEKKKKCLMDKMGFLADLRQPKAQPTFFHSIPEFEDQNMFTEEDL